MKFTLAMKKLIFLFLFFAYSSFSYAQYSLETVPVIKKQSSFNFTAEWQYLSTDMFLYNAEKFNLLLNDVIRRDFASKGKKMRKKDKIDLQKLLITANLKSIMGGDVVYPIYSFQIEEDQDQNYKANISKGYEQIRLMDNLPMVGKSDIIEAEIKAEAYSSKDINKVLKIISIQLQNIAKFSTPTAALELVAEFGKFMESSVMNTHYQFSNTIRIYESQDFNKRIHSINVYVFKPSGAEKIIVRDDAIENLLDTARYIVLSKNQIYDLIKYKKYPFFVIVNYKSRYVSDPIVGDEIDFEKISERKQKIENAYEAKLINAESYEQELKLIDFLKVFAQLKVHIYNYELNYKNKITEDFTKNYFIILSELRKLKSVYYTRLVEYENNTSFNNDFKAKYEAILLNAELYLESNTNLKNIKELVNVLYDFETKPQMNLNAEQREIALRKIYAVELPKSEQKSEVTTAITKLILDLEQKQYSEVFESEVKKLNSLQAIDGNLLEFEKVKNMANRTYCFTCKLELNKAVSSFNDRHEENIKQGLVLNLKEQHRLASDLVFTMLLKEECINNNVLKEFPDSISKPQYVIVYLDEYILMQKEREKLQNLIKVLSDNLSAAEMQSQIVAIKSRMLILKADLKNLCEKIPKYCKCEN